MNFLAFAIFSMLSIAQGLTMDSSMIYPQEYHKTIKRENAASKETASKSAKQKDFYEFVEEKLIQHSQALEHLVKLVNQAVSSLQNLAENLGENVEKPNLPQKIDIESQVQRRNADDDESRRSDLGNWFKRSKLFKFKSSSNSWCSVAILCHRTRNPVCGYDDSYGYGKFDDLCHMVRVNCYYNYNFTLVPYCKISF